MLLHRRYAVSKYEFFSNDLMLIYNDHHSKTSEEKDYMHLHERDTTHIESGPITDLTQYIRDNIGQYDCVVVYDEDERFENALDTALAGYDGNVAVYYRYKY